jgi:hypothetical protein
LAVGWVQTGSHSTHHWAHYSCTQHIVALWGHVHLGETALGVGFAPLHGSDGILALTLSGVPYSNAALNMRVGAEARG